MYFVFNMHKLLIYLPGLTVVTTVVVVVGATENNKNKNQNYNLEKFCI